MPSARYRRGNIRRPDHRGDRPRAARDRHDHDEHAQQPGQGVAASAHRGRPPSTTRGGREPARVQLGTEPCRVAIQHVALDRARDAVHENHDGINGMKDVVRRVVKPCDLYQGIGTYEL